MHRSTVRHAATRVPPSLQASPSKPGWGPGRQPGRRLQQQQRGVPSCLVGPRVPASAHNTADHRSPIASHFSSTKCCSSSAGCRRCLGSSVMNHLPRSAALRSRIASLPSSAPSCSGLGPALKGNYAFSFVSGCFTCNQMGRGNPIRVSFVTR